MNGDATAGPRGPSAIARERRLREIAGLGDDDVDVVEVALLLALADRPALQPGAYGRHIEALTETAVTFAESAARHGDGDVLQTRHAALVHAIHREHGYATPDDVTADPDAHDLTRVIDSRSGGSEAIGLIYLAVAEAAGWPMAMLDFPTRCILRIDHEAERRVINPAAVGAVLDPPALRAILKAEEGNHAELVPAHFEPIRQRAILLRLQRALKRAYLARNRLDDALVVVERTLKFAPAEAGLWREAGLLNARLDRVQDAVAALEAYLRHDGGEASRYNTSMLLQELRARLT